MMALTDTALTPDEAVRILQQWSLEIDAQQVIPASGTANAAAIIEAPDGRLFLKRRNPRYAREDWVRFDHALLAHLAAEGLPVPTAVPADCGAPWVSDSGAVYELFEFIEGDQHRSGDLSQLRAAGEILGRIHRSAESFEPPVQKQWERFHDPKRAQVWLAEALEAAGDETRARETLASALGQAQAVAERLTDEAYWSLPRAMVQADYHPANLKFRGEEVVGVFDWDWASEQPRMVDLADGLLFFCGVRDEAPVAGDIWSLTEAFDLDSLRAGAFGAGYTLIIEPESRELAALPDLMRARWLYCRADAAQRKIEAPRRVEFITRDLERPLAAIDGLESKLLDGSALQS